MVALMLGAVGLVAFFTASFALGLSLRSNPSKERAERLSRAMHLFFFAGLGLPFLVSLVSPWVTHLDELVGFDPLPSRPLFMAVGLILAIPGLYLLGVSNRLLRALGSGANAFRLTQRVVEGDIYRLTRNPMSLGYYLSIVGLALLIGSTLLTVYVIAGLIPAHLFFLKFFEERELELRLGESYRSYKQTVPFLVPARTKHPPAGSDVRRV
jgi:protein-S-isoprenylcysteine O-methyltransferase Ste14